MHDGEMVRARDFLVRHRQAMSGAAAGEVGGLSSAENNVVMQISPVGHNPGAFPLCGKMFYSTICDQEAKSNGEREVAVQGLVRETACAIVGKLKSGEVTPVHLRDVVE